MPMGRFWRGRARKARCRFALIITAGMGLLAFSCDPAPVETFMKNASIFDHNHLNTDDATSILDNAMTWKYAPDDESTLVNQFAQQRAAANKTLDSMPKEPDFYGIDHGKEVACGVIHYYNETGNWPTTDNDIGNAMKDVAGEFVPDPSLVRTTTENELEQVQAGNGNAYMITLGLACDASKAVSTP